MKKVFFILGISLIVACSNKNEPFFVEDKALQCEIPRGQEIRDCDLINDSTLLGVSDRNILYYWDINTGNIQKTDTIAYKRRIADVYFHNQDSIFLLPVYSYDFLLKQNDKIIHYLPEDLGEAVNKLASLDTLTSFFETFSSMNNEMTYINGKLLTPMSSDLYNGSLLNRAAYHFVSIDSSTVTAINSNVIRFPEHYNKLEETYGMLEYLSCYCLSPDNEIIVSFSCDHNLYIYNDSVLLRTIDAKIKDVNFPEMLNKKYFGNSKKEGEWLNTASCYTNILYDTYRKCYYRFALLNQAYKDEDGLINESALFKIAVFDLDFQCIGEQAFLDRRFLPVGALITEQGILLKNIENVREGKFTLFKINLKP